METLLFRIKTEHNPKLSDDALVDECMDRLIQKWPMIEGYQYERVEKEILILLWGDLNGPRKESE